MKKAKHLLSLLFAFIFLLSSTTAYSGAEIPHTNFAVLGDSIASGYGLKNTLDCYAAKVSAEKKYHLSNDAVPGHTTDDLLWVVCHSASARESIRNAHLISISIGGNDIIDFLSNADTSTLFNIMLNGTNSTAVKEEKEIITHNLNSICNEIRLLNPDAPIIFQTQYNPLYASEQYNSYAAFAENLVPVFDEIFNALCSKYANIRLADVHGAFDSYYKTSGSYDVIQSDSIHPSEKGHALIADVLLEVIGELEAEGLIPVAAKYYYLLGDTDGNQKITVSDATAIQKIVAGLLTFQGDIAKLCLDADENGAVNIKDATTIQKHIAGLESNKNIGTYLPFYE